MQVRDVMTTKSFTPPAQVLVLMTALMLAVAVSFEGLRDMVMQWSGREEYSHGFLIPLITLYLIWQRSPELGALRFEGSWAGAGLVVLGVLVFAAGELSSLFVIVQYSFLLMLYGLVLSLTGRRAFLLMAIPLLILFFMIPLPNFLYNNLSAKLQLLSSQIGVAVIRLFGISVFLEGNVIDLGTYKLQVVEACNGLRYLFPLVTLGFLMAYFFHAPLWKRAVVFASTVPITVLMNSFRIGVIGVTVDRWGQDMADGFLHDFEGWVIFMACFAVLFVEMWVLMRATGDRRPLREVFGMDAPLPASGPVRAFVGPVPKSALVGVLVLAAAAIVTHLLPPRQELIPARAEFGDFPLQLGEWQGQREQMESIYLDALKFTDYALINFRNPQGAGVNFYTAYYASQRKGESVHSPRSCLPGGGWEIQAIEQVPIEGVAVGGTPLKVNRVLISYGDEKQLVYYWFQQRGRVMTNEFLVKWYMLVDALFRQRTDGALVRLIMPLRPGEDINTLDQQLSQFAARLAPSLPAYLPD